MNLVDLAQVKLRLRIDSSHDDADIAMMIGEASAVVMTYVKYGKTEVSGDGEEISILAWESSVPMDVQGATLRVIANIERGESPLDQGVIDILTPYRDPTLA